MSKELATLIAALIGAIGGSVLGPVIKDRLADKQVRARRRERVVQLYLTQMQDAVRSLWHRFHNLSDRNGSAAMASADYWEVSMLYAWARVIAYSRILRLDGVYAQLETIGKQQLAESIRHLFDKLDDLLKDSNFQYYHRLTLAEAVITRSRGRLGTNTFLEFSHRYSQEERLRLALGPAKDYLEQLNGAASVKLADAMNLLIQLANQVADVTREPAEIPRTVSVGN